MVENVLGRKIEDLTTEFLINFFAQERIESDVLELKSYYEQNEDPSKDKVNDKQNDVLKTICAFLNSSGGVLIWGAPIGRMVEKVKVFSGELSPVIRYIEKDSFINRLADKTVPLPNNIRFLLLEVETGKFVYIIEVLESLTKPHQFDNRYFTRLDGQTRVAPHHYIEALFKQIRFPDIRGYIKINTSKKNTMKKLGATLPVTSYHLSITVFIINFSPFQNEENISYRLLSDFGRFSKASNKILFLKDKHEVIEENAVPILSFGTPFMSEFSVQFQESELIDYRLIARILLDFGGKHSPRRTSAYKIDLSISPTNDNMNDLFVDISENKTFYETQMEIGATVESTLKFLLNR